MKQKIKQILDNSKTMQDALTTLQELDISPAELNEIANEILEEKVDEYYRSFYNFMTHAAISVNLSTDELIEEMIFHNITESKALNRTKRSCYFGVTTISLLLLMGTLTTDSLRLLAISILLFIASVYYKSTKGISRNDDILKDLDMLKIYMQYKNNTLNK